MTIALIALFYYATKVR